MADYKGKDYFNFIIEHNNIILKCIYLKMKYIKYFSLETRNKIKKEIACETKKNYTK